MMITYTNLAFPRNVNNIPINAFDSSLWREKYPQGVCYKQQKEDVLVWYLGHTSTPVVDASKFQWVLSSVKTLEIHGTGGQSIQESVRSFLREAVGKILPPHCRESMYRFVDSHIPHVRTVDNTPPRNRNDDDDVDDGVFFFGDGSICRTHRVITASQ